MLHDAGEQCDDGNHVNGDGCSSTCQIELGWNCSTFTACHWGCGDGFILQQNATYANGTSYIAYEEKCDSGPGCTACTPDLGWTCTTNYVTWVSTCIQTCGDNLHEAWEVCDDGNNLSGDGCAAGCMAVEPPYQCLLVGPCYLNCGNGIFEGVDNSVGQFVGNGTHE